VTQPLFAIGFIGIFIFAYAVFASVDFGTGVLYVIASLRGRKKHVKALIDAFQSPIWEVINVFLVFVLIGLIGFFPGSALYFGTSLLIPGSIALVFMVLRGFFVVFQHYLESESLFISAVHGLSGLFVPAALVCVLPISEGGFVIQTGPEKLVVHFGHLLMSPMLWLFILLALSSVGYFSTIYMAYYAKKQCASEAEKFFRPLALFTGPPTFIFAGLTAWSLKDEAPLHFAKMMHVWPLFALSALLFLLAGRMIYTRNYGSAFIAVVWQYAIAVGTYGWTHLPYLMYPYLTLTNGFTSGPMFTALLVAMVVGLAILLPALVLFYRIFLRQKQKSL
jgi:cytochrome bd ubiquinol oxidase subunit II